MYPSNIKLAKVIKAIEYAKTKDIDIEKLIKAATIEEPKVSRQLSFNELKTLKGIRASRQTIWRWVRDGRFPQPHETGTGHIWWWEHEVDEYLAALQRGKGRKPPEKAA